MNVSKERLYDTEEAMTLSHQLTTGTTPHEKGDTTSPYIRFSSGSRTRPEPRARQSVPAPSAATEAEVVIELPEDPFGSWEEMLKWSREVAGATSCFVVDSQGFVLMRNGEDLPEDGYEGVGANLGIAVDQLNQMEMDSGDIQVADLMYQNRTLLVIRVKDKDGDFFTLGMMDADRVSPENKKQIYRQVRRSLAQMAF
jgi:hypothetical protein